MKLVMKVAAAGLLAGALTACGGGGGGGSSGNACASGDIFATFTYPSMSGNIGTTMSAAPAISGVPASCTNAMRFSLELGALPPGVSLNASTGLVSGTPTASGSYTYSIRLTVNGFSGSLSGGITSVINDPARYTFSGWERLTTNAPFLDDFRIATLGGRLIVVSRGFYTHVVETYESSDGGASWTLLPVAGPSGDLRGFSLASDGNFIYFSGGSDGVNPTNSVWRFDGAAWTQMTAAAAFPAREGHAMVSHAGALYVLGGRAGTTSLGDTWKSTDAGVTWTQAAAAGFRPRSDFCAVSDGTGSLYVLGGQDGSGSGPGRILSGPTVSDAVYRSADGVTWTPITVSASSPLMTALGDKHSGACALLGNRIVYVGDGTHSGGLSGVVSTVDGANWSYEPGSILDLVDLSPGGVVLDGRVYVTAGSGTSQRRVVRSTP